MPAIKTAVSIEASTFEQVNELAEELQVSRSRVFALAVEEFIRRHRERRMLEALNEVYGDGPDAEDQALQEGMRQVHRRLVEKQW